jgi:hypothetical protein
MDVAAFFAVCVWFVPLFLFLSLSANDNVLPQMGESIPISNRPKLIAVIADQAPGTPSGLGRTVDLSSSPRSHLSKLDTTSGAGYDYLSSQPRPRGNTSLVKSLLSPILALVPGTRRSAGNRQNDEGIIAPRTPLRGSPLPSPRLSNVNLSLGGSAGAGSYSPWADNSGSNSGGFVTPRDALSPAPTLQPNSSGRTLAAPVSGTPSIAQRRASPHRSPSSSSGMGLQMPGSPVGGPPRRVPSEVRVPSMASSRVSMEEAGGALGVVIGGNQERTDGLTARRGGRKDD